MCRRMKEHGTWGVEQDWYGFYRTIYLLLVGKEMEGPDHFKEAEKGAKYDAKCLPFLGKRQSAHLKLKDKLWIDLFLTLLNFDSRKDSYQATVNELLGKMEAFNVAGEGNCCFLVVQQYLYESGRDQEMTITEF